MKISQKVISIIGVLIILVLLLAKGPATNVKQSHFFERAFTPQRTKFTEINNNIDLTKRRLDSLNFSKNDDVNEGYSYSGWVFDNIGIGGLTKRGMRFPDSVKYLKLGNIGVDINEDLGKYFLFYYEKNGQAYLSRAKFLGNYTGTTEVYNNGRLISSEGNKVLFIDKKVNYKYLYAEKSILVPLKSRLAEIGATIILWTITFLQFSLTLIVLGLFFRFLMFVAKNNAFEEGNIHRLKLMSIIFFILAAHKYIISGITYLIFISSYSSDGVVINYSFWKDDYLMMIFSILCYLIYTAFKRGMALQEENELTI